MMRREISTKELMVAMAIALMLFSIPGAVTSQSGRAQLPDSKKQKPEKPPATQPPPKIRLPENQPRDNRPGEDTIRINSDLVTVVTTVSTNSMVDPTPLKLEDFEVFEDGVRQEIANFARDSEQPIQLVMLFDASLSVAQKLDFERKAIIRFFERVLRPQDRAALFAVSTEVTVLQDFTGRGPQLIQAAKQLKAQGATSLYDGVFLAAEYLKPAEGRRVMVIVSDGSDTTSQKGLLAALEKAQQADTMIYAVYTGNFGISQNLRDLAGERALETLTGETGGELFRPRATPGSQTEEVDEQSLRELDRAFASLSDQLRTQYVLGFFSSNDKRDGSFRKLTVRVKKNGLQARARAGYYAPKG